MATERIGQGRRGFGSSERQSERCVLVFFYIRASIPFLFVFLSPGFVLLLFCAGVVRWFAGSRLLFCLVVFPLFPRFLGRAVLCSSLSVIFIRTPALLPSCIILFPKHHQLPSRPTPILPVPFSPLRLPKHSSALRWLFISTLSGRSILLRSFDACPWSHLTHSLVLSLSHIFWVSYNCVSSWSPLFMHLLGPSFVLHDTL